MKSVIKALVFVTTCMSAFQGASADTRLLCNSIQKIASADGSFRAPLQANIMGSVYLNSDASFEAIRGMTINGPFFAKGDMVATAYRSNGKSIVFGSLHDNWHMFEIELKRNGTGRGALIVTDEARTVRYPINCSVRSFGAKTSQ